jgi:RNA-directed DNA polymerase
VIEPIFEKTFCESSFGFRPQRSNKDALRATVEALKSGKLYVVDADISKCFDEIPHEPLLERIGEQISDSRMMTLIGDFLKQGIMEAGEEWEPQEGTPQGGPLSPLLANIYLNPVDWLMHAKGYTSIRFADDIVITTVHHPGSDRLLKYSKRRIEEELERLGVELNLEKTKIVDLEKGETFNLLGFTWRLVVSRKGKKYPLLTPRPEKRNAILKKVREIIRRNWSEKLPVVIGKLNQVLRGWVNYFRIGHASEVFSYVRWYVEKRVRRFVRKKQKRPGYGFKVWSTGVIYRDWGLYSDYQIRYYRKAS